MQFDNNAQNTLIEGPRQIFQSFSQITILKTYLISFRRVLCIKDLLCGGTYLKWIFWKRQIFMINKFVDLICKSKSCHQKEFALKSIEDWYIAYHTDSKTRRGIHFMWNFIIQKLEYSERVEAIEVLQSTRSEYLRSCIICK